MKSDAERERQRMVERQIRSRDIHDPRVLDAMATVPRHLFVPPGWRKQAYDDTPLPLGVEQTISQPYIVAYLCERLELPAGARVLELGTGSGYQAAVLAEMGFEVYSIEIDARLSARAAENLREAGYPDVRLRAGDGSRGWPEAAPFDGIVLTAAAGEVPARLKDQLADGGTLIAPVGGFQQNLVRLRRRGERFDRETLIAVRFVRLLGEAENVLDD